MPLRAMRFIMGRVTHAVRKAGRIKADGIRKKPTSLSAFVLASWCPGEDSNLHTLRH
jgi:hypothetical protein